jgi:putative ABC transport system substrate-binding protein
MKRREFMAGAAMAATLLRANAQQPANPRRLALVHTGITADHLTEKDGPFWIRHFHATLRALGEIEGQNLIIERYSAEGHSDRFASIVTEVVSRRPDVVVSNFNDLVKMFMDATTAIPIVGITGDPVAAGLVKNLARPSGNLTGVSINAGIDIYGKRLQILKEMLPQAAKVSYLLSGAWSDTLPVSSYREAGSGFGIDVVPKLLPDVSEEQLGRTFAELAHEQMHAVLVDEGGSFLAQRALVVKLADQFRLPVIYPYRDYVDLGGLAAYAPDLTELADRLANDVHQILNGTRAGDIPFLLPSKFLLVINMKTVRALDLVLPPPMLARADELIE